VLEFAKKPWVFLQSSIWLTLVSVEHAAQVAPSESYSCNIITFHTDHQKPYE
jgi:hypothetical protein